MFISKRFVPEVIHVCSKPIQLADPNLAESWVSCPGAVTPLADILSKAKQDEIDNQAETNRRLEAGRFNPFRRDFLLESKLPGVVPQEAVLSLATHVSDIKSRVQKRPWLAARSDQCSAVIQNIPSSNHLI